jgi:hypothetical protein
MAKQTFTTGQVLTAAQMTSLQQTAMLGGAASAKVASYVLVAADAGDAITMNNAGATTITANTGLFATGDIVTIINIGTGTCTITAGTATVTTSGSLVLAQNQGGVLRFTSPSAAIFLQFATPASGDIEGVTAGTGLSGGGTSGTVTLTNDMATTMTTKGDIVVATGSGTYVRQAVGTNNQVLMADSVQADGVKYANEATATLTTTGDILYASAANTLGRRAIGSTGDVLTVSGGLPTWAAPAGGGGMTSIASGSLSGSSVSLTSISGTYKNLVLIIRNMKPSDDGADLIATVNAVTTSVYGKSGSITELNINATSTSWLQFSRRQDNNVSNGLMQYTFIDYANATTWKMVDAFAMSQDSVDTTQWNIQRSSFITKQTAAISSIQLFPDTGTFTSGTYILYGVN